MERPQEVQEVREEMEGSLEAKEKDAPGQRGECFY